MAMPHLIRAPAEKLSRTSRRSECFKKNTTSSVRVLIILPHGCETDQYHSIVKTFNNAITCRNTALRKIPSIY